MQSAVYPEDLPLFSARFSKENILREIAEKGLFQIRYRLILKGEPRPVILKIVSVREDDGDKLIAGVRAWRDRSGNSGG